MEISGYLDGLVVVVVLSLVMVVPSGCVMLRLTVEEVVDGSLAGGVVTTVVELAGGGVVVLGTTTVVSLVTDGPGVVVVTVRSQPVTTAEPKARNAMAGMSLFMTSPWDVVSQSLDPHNACQVPRRAKKRVDSGNLCVNFSSDGNYFCTGANLLQRCSRHHDGSAVRAPCRILGGVPEKISGVMK
jgi:hypothetical protein